MGSFEPLIAPIADDHLRAKGAVRHEPCARLVARMFTFWAKSRTRKGFNDIHILQGVW